MSEINYYSAAAFTNNVAVARREDVESALGDLRAALAKVEQDIEDRDRAIESLRLKVDTAHGHIDALKARAERLAKECAALMRAIDDVARFVVIRGMVSEEHYAANKRLHDARAAVDAHGDLEATP